VSERPGAMHPHAPSTRHRRGGGDAGDDRQREGQDGGGPPGRDGAGAPDVAGVPGGAGTLRSLVLDGLEITIAGAVGAVLTDQATHPSRSGFLV